MAIDTKLFETAIEEFKQHLHAARELIGDEVINHVIGQLSRAHNLDMYFRDITRDMGLPTLRRIGRGLATSDVVDTISRTKVEVWMQLDALYEEWKQLVNQAGGPTKFSFAYSEYTKRTRTYQRPH